MKTLVIGRPDSGKSSLAEDIICGSGSSRRYYLATMRVMDEAGKKRVDRHKRLRRGKDFVTLEIPEDIRQALGFIEDPGSSALLIEDISNLAGNEMHRDSDGHEASESGADPEQITEKIINDIEALSDAVRDICAVSSIYDGDAPGYDEDTRRYVRLLDTINDRLIRWADRVYERGIEEADGTDKA